MTLLRQYERWECLNDGYPEAWHRSTALGSYPADHALSNPAIKDLIRMEAGNRCLRCGHPYTKGMFGDGKWTPCDDHCTHPGPFALIEPSVYAQSIGGPLVPVVVQTEPNLTRQYMLDKAEELGGDLPWILLAEWRILTVHHLDEDKMNCRWWNLAALCQRCHLRMQRAVVMGRPYHYEHSEWFKPFAAGFYAWKYLGEDLGREETLSRLPELLALEHKFVQETLL